MNQPLCPVGIVVTFYPAGRRGAWLQPQRVEIKHDAARCGVWATVSGARRLFCLATGVELSAARADRMWMIKPDALALLRPMLGLPAL